MEEKNAILKELYYNYKALHESVEATEGWFNILDEIVFHLLLINLKQYDNRILEFGVWKGKSALVLSKYANCVLVDINKHKLNDLLEKDEFVNTYCEDFKTEEEFKLIHIDASHLYEMTYRNLIFAKEHITKNGIIVMDDFFNIAYPSVTQVVFEYLHDHSWDLVPFFATPKKIYLCRPSKQMDYRDIILSYLLQAGKSLNVEIELYQKDIGIAGYWIPLTGMLSNVSKINLTDRVKTGIMTSNVTEEEFNNYIKRS